MIVVILISLWHCPTVLPFRGFWVDDRSRDCSRNLEKAPYGPHMNRPKQEGCHLGQKDCFILLLSLTDHSLPVKHNVAPALLPEHRLVYRAKGNAEAT